MTLSYESLIFKQVIIPTFPDQVGVPNVSDI